MSDSEALRAAAERLADRYRSLPASRLRRAAGAGLALARELSATAQRIELPGRDPLVMPDDGIFVVGDQIAVAAHDLAAALDAHGGAPAVPDAALHRIEAVAGAL